MTTNEQTHLRARLRAVRKADLTEAVILATSRIGGVGALLRAITEMETERSLRQARSRIRHSIAREVRL